MKKEFLAQLGQVAGMEVSENSNMGEVFKNLSMLLSEVDLYLFSNYGIMLTQREKDMVLKKDVGEFVGFLERKLKEKNMQTIADIMRRVGNVSMSTYVDAQDRVCELLDLDDEGQVARFLIALELEFDIKPTEEEAANFLKMTLLELAESLSKIK